MTVHAAHGERVCCTPRTWGTFKRAPSAVIIVVAPSVRAGPRKPMTAQAMAARKLAEEKPNQKRRVDAVARAVKPTRPNARINGPLRRLENTPDSATPVNSCATCFSPNPQ